MTRTITATCAAAALALGLGLTASAQTNSSAYQNDNNKQTMTVTGCLQKTQSGGYFLTHARATNGNGSRDESGSQNNQATSSSSQESQSSMAMTAANTWNLRGDHSDQWKGHVGEKIEVTGNPASTTSGDKLATGQSSSSSSQMNQNGEIQARDFTVTGHVRVLASSCQ
ncbi:MAG TPA: hypothetical protein VIC33_09480 [Vicinamibacterales bacterium]|jgi:hypothetical protein